MREIDEIHHAEHQRQPGRDQEQQDAELQAVQDLDQQERADMGSGGRRAGGDPSSMAVSAPCHDFFGGGVMPNSRPSLAPAKDTNRAGEAHFIAQSLA